MRAAIFNEFFMVFLKFLNEILIYFARKREKWKEKGHIRIKEKCVLILASVNLSHIVILPCITSITTKQVRYFSYLNVNYEPSTRFLFYFICCMIASCLCLLLNHKIKFIQPYIKRVFLYYFFLLTAVGTRCADHATPLYPQKSALLRRQRRSLGQYSSLAD
jgi:hypothetical protein